MYIKYTKPPKNQKELRERIEGYFASREGTKYDKSGNAQSVTFPYTVTGLCIALGLNSRDELFSFKDEKMQVLVNIALLKIEEYAEEKLFSKEAGAGVKLFLAVNFDRWNDKETASEESFDFLLPDEVVRWSE